MHSPSKAEIRQKYDAFAPKYDWVEGIPELLGVRKLRQRLLERARGRVLEVAAGTGKSFFCYLRGCRVTAVDLSPGMLRLARHRAERLELKISFSIMDAEALAFPDQWFDTVVDTMTLCTYADPLAALREMRRVCRADGCLLLLEHGRSDRAWLGRWQDRRAPAKAADMGCWWNREPLELVRAAGLEVVQARRTFLGIFHSIEARPA